MTPPKDGGSGLEPCPFCGCHAEIEETSCDTLPGVFWEIKCDSCPALMTLSDREAVIAAWNTRRYQAQAPAIGAVWQTMASAPKDGSEFLICYPLQGNVLGLCRWGSVQKQWLNKGTVIFPESNECLWVRVLALAAVRGGSK